MKEEKVKPYLIVVIITIILIAALSIAIMGISTSMVQTKSTKYAETLENIENFVDLAEDDIEIILQEDSSRYEIAYSYLTDLYYLNDKYSTMIDYNITHPKNYTQFDFDELKNDFLLKLRAINNIVNKSVVHYYSTEIVNANAYNDYTYLGFQNLYITNLWDEYEDAYQTFHNDIKSFVAVEYASSSDPLVLPLINLETWSYHLNNNLSILEFVGHSVSIEYGQILVEDIGISLVNLSLSRLASYRDSYITLSEIIATTVHDFNNAIITLALAGVLMGFATSFDNIKLRYISMVIGLIILALAIFYFTSAFATFIDTNIREATIVTENEFIFL